MRPGRVSRSAARRFSHASRCESSRTGTAVEFLVDGRIQLNGDAGLLNYLNGTTLVNPHLELTYKLPELDDGEGVLFLKARSAAHAREIVCEAARSAAPKTPIDRIYLSLRDRQGIFQQYVKTPFVDDRRLFKTRAYVLMTPLGARYLSSQRTICAKPVPAQLPFGVCDGGPFLVSYRPGSRWVLTPPEDEERLRAAALGVARGLSEALEHGFRTGPNQPDP